MLRVQSGRSVTSCHLNEDTAKVMTALAPKTFWTRLKTNRYLLRLAYYPWVVLPPRPRRAASIAGVWWLQVFKRARGIHRRWGPTPPSKMFSLSFWGVPRVDVTTYTLTVDGSVERPVTLTLAELQALPAVERDVARAERRRQDERDLAARSTSRPRGASPSTAMTSAR